MQSVLRSAGRRAAGACGRRGCATTTTTTNSAAAVAAAEAERERIALLVLRELRAAEQARAYLRRPAEADSFLKGMEEWRRGFWTGYTVAVLGCGYSPLHSF
ncbi:hypothetical protein ACP70R_043233 [Stipagrostis hirtigluma subsp. patula]